MSSEQASRSLPDESGAIERSGLKEWTSQSVVCRQDLRVACALRVQTLNNLLHSREM